MEPLDDFGLVAGRKPPVKFAIDCSMLGGLDEGVSFLASSRPLAIWSTRPFNGASAALRAFDKVVPG